MAGTPDGVRVSAVHLVELVKTALIVGIILGVIKMLLPRFGGPLGKYAGMLG